MHQQILYQSREEVWQRITDLMGIGFTVIMSNIEGSGWKKYNSLVEKL
jgi:hypothetical protein